MTRRHPLFGPLVAAYAIAVMSWCFIEPYTPQKIARAIPAHADFLSSHRDLAARWDEIGGSALVETVFTASGMKPDEYRAMNADPQFRDWMNRLLPGEFIAARVPHLGGGRPSWVFVAWLGGRSAAYRLALQLSDVPGIRLVGKHDGWPIWSAEKSRSKMGEIFSISIVDGMIVAAYGAGTQPLETALDCVNGGHPSLAASPEAIIGGSADSGWFKLEGSPHRFDANNTARFELTTFTSNKLAGRLSVPRPLLDGAAQIRADNARGIAELQTDLPATVAILPPKLAAKWTAGGADDGVRAASAELLRSQASGPVFASFFGGDYRGRFMQIRVPGLVLAAPSTNTASLATDTARLIEAINTQKPWRLELEEKLTNGFRLGVVVGRASNTVYGMTKPGDQFAVASGADWIALLSCVGAFEKITGDAVLRANRPLRLQTIAEAAAKRGASAALWMDFAATAPALRSATGTWVLRLKSENTRSSQQLRAQINDAMHWFNGLQPLGQLEACAMPEGSGTRIEFSSSPAPAR